MIRDVVRTYLQETVPLVDSRVYDTGGAALTNDKPYLVVVRGPGLNNPDWDGFDGELSVYIYGEETLFVEVDRVEKQVVTALNHIVLYDPETQRHYGFEYDRTPTPDRQDDTILHVYTREVVFRVYDYGWVDSLTYDPDPADLLSRLATAMFPEIGSRPAMWTVSDARPGIYFRVSREVSRSGLENWGGTWVEAMVACHIIAPSPVVRANWVRQVTEFLSTYLDAIPINSQDFMHILPPVTANMRANAARDGQITFNVRFAVDPKNLPGSTGPTSPMKINEFDVTFDGLIEVVGQRTT